MTFTLALFFFILGAVLGSFICVVAERIYTHQSWLQGRSRCNSCARPLGFFDLLPILSWVSTGGKCRTCRSRIPITYLWVEIALGLSFAVSFLILGASLSLAFFLASLVVLMLIVVYDIRHTIVPPIATSIFVVLALLYAFLKAPTLKVLGVEIIIAAFIGIAFYLIYFLSRGRAMGLGDAPVAFAGALLAGPVALTGLVFSFWIGAIYGITLLVLGRNGTTMQSEIPFVPFLAAGFLLALFTGWNIFPF